MGGTDMGDEQRNKDIVRKVEQAWVDGKLDQLDQYFAPGDHSHDRPPGVPQGLAGAKVMHQNRKRTFQGRKLEMKAILAECEKGFVRLVSSSSDTARLPEIPEHAGGRPMRNIES